MTPQIIDKTKQVLKGARSMGLLNADEVGQVMSALKAMPEALDDRLISRPQLAQRWDRSPRQIYNMEKAGIIRRLGMPGRPKYSMSQIRNVEAGIS